MRKHRGFTLIEVMIVVAMIAILAAVALPIYTSYVMRANVTDAIKGLSEQRLKLEQYFQDQRTYVGACAANTLAPKPLDTANFTFDCPTLASDSYLVTATGIGAMNGFVYTIDQKNTQATTGTAAGWPTCPSRWVTKKSDSCS